MLNKCAFKWLDHEWVRAHTGGWLIVNVMCIIVLSAGKLASLEEFRIQREELMSQTAKLEAMLVDQENAHREQVYNLEKKQVIDKDKWAKS